MGINAKKYIKIWFAMTMMTTQIAFTSRVGAVIFIIGKLLRFFLFLVFLLLLGSKTQVIAGYTLWQMIFFFFTFNLIDTSAQFFFREVYRFRSYVLKGFLDYILVKPFSALFRSLFGGSDILDIPLLFISVISLLVSSQHIGHITLLGAFLYIVLICNAFFIALSFHIFVLSIGILTTEVDNTLFLYRDLTQMGRVPIDIYQEPLRGFLTFIIPIGVMITFPAKALMNLLALPAIILSVAIGGIIFLLTLRFWQYALKNYASASS